MRQLVLTPGEPAGIGPEIACRMAAGREDLVLVADPGMLERTLKRLDLKRNVVCLDEVGRANADEIACLPVNLSRPEQPGVLDPDNAGYVLDALRLAGRLCIDGQAAGLVTGPVHKAVINEAGIPFTGHTEFLAELVGIERVVMLLAAGRLRVALATTHLPLARVPGAITTDHLEQTLRILHDDLCNKFRIAEPAIAVLGLNPHAGEGGHLGREEIEVIEPVLERLRGRGMNLIGPLPADTAFVPDRASQFDAILAMYHDQGLPVLKYAGFGQAVNVTLGLPFVRTSVDHGTALNLAGTGQADAGSLAAAIDLARRLSGDQ